MQICKTIDELSVAVAQMRGQGKTIGLVPTMGALHEGHLKLVAGSRSVCDATIATIYVNPTQFAANEDLFSYPRPLDEDIAQLRAEGVDAVFTPSDREMFPEGFSTYVEPPEIATRWEGQSRPTHFRGVATVVLKLFNLARPDVAWFGQKDYQQAQVIRKMVKDLNIPVMIRICPTERAADGIALSSRNAYLDDSARKIATALYHSLRHARQTIEQGEADAHAVSEQMRQQLIDAGVEHVDYAGVADAETLEPLETVRRPLVLLIAARVSGIRLIDNEVMY